MSFEAVIDIPENKVLWCRCLNALAALSDDISFVCTPTQLIVSARNTGDTTFMDVIFARTFFKSFKFDVSAVQEGISDLNGERSYALTVRSKLLSMLFKKHEDEVDTFKLTIDAREQCPVNLKYRLQIDVMTKSSILKRFTPFYNPTSPTISKLAEVYKESFLQQKRTGRYNGANYMMLSNGMLKGFLENTGTTTEHLRFVVSSQKFSITAFTRGVYIKEKEILKQPMAVNMQFRSEDLHGLEIGDDDNGNGNNSNNVVIRLKDFKNFLSLGLAGEVVECYFKKAGDPILFEMLKNNITIQLIQDTDGENHITNDQQPRVRPSHSVQRPPLPAAAAAATATATTRIQRPPEPVIPMRSTNKSTMESLLLPVMKEPLFVPAEEEQEEQPYDDDKENGNNEENDDNDSALGPTPHPETNNRNQEGENNNNNINNNYGDEEEEEEQEERITWGDPASDTLTLKRLMNTRKQVIEEAKSQYLESVKKRKLEKQQQKEREQIRETDSIDELGPTQNVPKIKGLFD